MRIGPEPRTSTVEAIKGILYRADLTLALRVSFPLVPQTPLTALPKGIFFDLDDTLCAYWDACKVGLRRAFEAHGHEPEVMVGHWAAAFRDFSKEIKSPDWYSGYLLSGERTRTEQMRRALLRVGVEDAELAARLSQSYMEERHRELNLFPDAMDLLTDLKGRYSLGLMTNGPADIQRQEVEKLEIGHFFDPILIEGEMGVGKPKPVVFDRAEALMNLTGAEILMVGNSYSHDIRPALERGWQAIWIRRPSDVPPSANNDAVPEERPTDSPAPTAVISQLLDLRPWLFPS
jgi:putative hydrolase of the HAD superfamily